MSSELARRARRALSRVFDLPPPVCDFVVHRELRVPMRDRVELVADHYAPHTASPAGTLLVRGPYGRGLPFATVFASFYAARGYRCFARLEDYPVGHERVFMRKALVATHAGSASG